MPDRSKGAARTQSRHGPARTLPWDEILDRWAAGEHSESIAKACKCLPASVRRVTCLARRRGDERAKRRRAPPGKPGTGSMQAGAWVPYYADPRQLPLPLGLPSRPDRGSSP